MGKLTQKLLDPSRSGAYRVAATDAVEDAVRGTGLELVRVPPARDKAALMRAFSDALGFPAWFGANWDALEDCLGDLSWRDAGGQVLLLEGAQSLPRDDLGVLTDVLQASAALRGGSGKPFFAVFVDPKRAVALPDLYRGA